MKQLLEPAEATTLWSRIWSEEVSYNGKASWLKDIELKLSTTGTQEDIIITMEDMRNGVNTMANYWKAAGPDLVHGYWFKKLTGIHTRLQECLQDCVRQGSVPEWMATSRTVLIQKDPVKCNQASNYRPITCLPMMWKLLTGITREKLYQHLERNELLVDEQKDCKKGT